LVPVLIAGWAASGYVRDSEGRRLQKSKKVKYREILRRYCREAAGRTLADIPVRVPLWFPEDYRGFSSEDSLLYDIADVCLGLWPGEYVVVPEDLVSPESTILHEYTHHAQRKGLIDMEGFRKHYRELRNDPRYRGAVEWVERESRTNLLQKIVGWGRDTERAAYLAELSAANPCAFPAAMHEPYRRFLKASAQIIKKETPPR